MATPITPRVRRLWEQALALSDDSDPTVRLLLVTESYRQSEGQPVILRFARALAHDPRILVLDEATSSVDTETERLIQDATQKLMAGRTAIVIAHRLSTILNADKIIVIHRGEVRERGTHEQLVAQGGIYYKLYQLQYKDQLAAAD